MRGVIGVIAVLIALAVFSPFVCAATYEAWPAGLSDAELNQDIFVVLTLAAVINGTVLTAAGRPTIVVAFVVLTDETGGDLAEPSTRGARAPPSPSVLPC